MVTAGERHSIVCRITRVDTLADDTLLEVTWLDHNNKVITPGPTHTITGPTSTTETSLTSNLTFTTLTTSQGGRYTCLATMTIFDIIEDNVEMATSDLFITSKSLPPFLLCLCLATPPLF